jgi:hypothetical protein
MAAAKSLENRSSSPAEGPKKSQQISADFLGLIEPENRATCSWSRATRRTSSELVASLNAKTPARIAESTASSDQSNFAAK